MPEHDSTVRIKPKVDLSVQLNFLISDELKKKLEKKAFAVGLTLSELCRTILDQVEVIVDSEKKGK